LQRFTAATNGLFSAAALATEVYVIACNEFFHSYQKAVPRPDCRLFVMNNAGQQFEQASRDGDDRAAWNSQLVLSPIAPTTGQ
jgi:hypothetical protein